MQKQTWLLRGTLWGAYINKLKGWIHKKYAHINGWKDAPGAHMYRFHAAQISTLFDTFIYISRLRYCDEWHYYSAVQANKPPDLFDLAVRLDCWTVSVDPQPVSYRFCNAGSHSKGTVGYKNISDAFKVSVWLIRLEVVFCTMNRARIGLCVRNKVELHGNAASTVIVVVVSRPEILMQMVSSAWIIDKN